MNRFKVSVIVFCAFLSSNAANSNPSFIDTISIPGAKCIISIPIDSNSFFKSFNHPCRNYYFFKLVGFPSFLYSNLLIDFTSTAKCSLLVKQSALASPDYTMKYNDTLPLACDSLKYYSAGSTVIDTSDKIIIGWDYPLPVGKRLAKRLGTDNIWWGDLLHFILKSASDSSELYLSRTIYHPTIIIPPTGPYQIENNNKFTSKAYTINGALIQSNRRLPSVYILKENAAAASMVHLNKF